MLAHLKKDNSKEPPGVVPSLHGLLQLQNVIHRLRSAVLTNSREVEGYSFTFVQFSFLCRYNLLHKVLLHFHFSFICCTKIFCSQSSTCKAGSGRSWSSCPSGWPAAWPRTFSDIVIFQLNQIFQHFFRCHDIWIYIAGHSLLLLLAHPVEWAWARLLLAPGHRVHLGNIILIIIIIIRVYLKSYLTSSWSTSSSSSSSSSLSSSGFTWGVIWRHHDRHHHHMIQYVRLQK